MLTSNGHLLAIDPRNRIYAFLGLVDLVGPCHSDPTLILDYTKRLSDLLIRVVVHLLKHHGLDVLSFATVGLILRKFIYDVFSCPVISGPGSFVTDVFFSPEELRPTSPSLFNTSRGLEVQGEGYKIVERRGPRTDFVELVCSGFTLDTIAAIGVQRSTGTTIDKILGFADISGPDWASDGMCKHIPTQGRWEAVIRTAFADQCGRLRGTRMLGVPDWGTHFLGSRITPIYSTQG
jgi:hypothetical protein